MNIYHTFTNKSRRMKQIQWEGKESIFLTIFILFTQFAQQSLRPHSKYERLEFRWGKLFLFPTSKKNNYFEVDRYHILRLLFELKRMMSLQPIKVSVDGWERDILFAIRAEAVSKVILNCEYSIQVILSYKCYQEEFKKLVDDNLAEVTAMQKTTALPPPSPTLLHLLDNILLTIRKR